MKKIVVLSLATLAFSIVANAAEIRIQGTAAQELYSKLNIAETPVRDEHGGPVIAMAKYGKQIGCQRSAEGNVECWISER